MADHVYAVIMAGGGGTRLWPVSRNKNPKQMLQLFNGRSLFQIAVDRLSEIFTPESIFVVTVAAQVEELEKQEPAIPKGNFLVEPLPRGTASVVAMASAALLKKDPDAVLAVLTADHMIKDISQFINALHASYTLANTGFIVTLGIKPSAPATGYGYIQAGQSLGEFDAIQAYRVNQFIEKPDFDRALQLCKDPVMSWNSGMFIFRANVMRAEIENLMPELHTSIETLLPELGEDHSSQRFLKEWSGIRSQTIDYGIMEKCTRSAVIPVELGWQDVGSWDSFFDVFPADESGNITLTDLHIGIDTGTTLVVSDEAEKLVVTIGIQNMIIINTRDALLICPRGDSQKIKELVNYLKENHYTLFL